MAIASLRNLIDQLRRSKVLLQEQQHELTGALYARFPEPRDLARELIRRKWLTPFQMNEIAGGRGDDLLLGPYLILDRIGEGGMGQVFKARHRSIDRLVALKVIRKECVHNPTVIRRFEREVQMAAQLHHPHIVRAFDADQIDNRYYFVMEYMEGVDLAKLVKEHGPVRLLQACDYVRQAALGLQHAHEHGMIHRDIKPANLLVSRGGSLGKGHSSLLPRPYANALQWGVLKILDMGLARLQDRDDEPVGTMLTQVGSVMGTPDFIAPEQARSSLSTDIRSDLYSLGCTFYFLLTGQVPFPRGTLTEKLLHHQLDEPEVLEQVRATRLCEKLRLDGSRSPKDDPELLLTIAGLVRRLMAKRPEDRYQTPADLADALTDLVRQAQPPAPRSSRSLKKAKSKHRAVPIATPYAPPPQSLEAALLGQTTVDLPKATNLIPRPPRRYLLRRHTLGVLLLLLLSGLGLGLVANLLSGQAPRSEEPTPQPPAPRVVSPAQLGWRKLQARLQRPDSDAALLCRDLIEFRMLFPRSPEAQQVATMLVRLPSPLDQLPLTKIPTRERRVWQPLELVAVLGERKPAMPNPIYCIGFSPDGRQIARGGTAGVRLWDTATLREGPKLVGPQDKVVALAFAPGGKTLATGGQDGAIHIWDSTTGLRLASLREHKKEVVALLFHPEGKYLLSLSQDGVLIFWDPTLARATRTVEGRQDFWPVSLAMTPDGRTLACGQIDGTVRLFSLETHLPLASTPPQAGPVRVLAFSGDGKRLVTSGPEGTIKLYDWDDNHLKERVTLKGHKGLMKAAVFSSDGRFLFTSSTDRSISLWEVASGRKWQDQEGLPQDLDHLTLAPDGRHLAAAGPTSLVFLVRLAAPLREQVAQAAQ